MKEAVSNCCVYLHFEIFVWMKVIRFIIVVVWPIQIGFFHQIYTNSIEGTIKGG